MTFSLIGLSRAATGTAEVEATAAAVVMTGGSTTAEDGQGWPRVLA